MNGDDGRVFLYLLVDNGLLQDGSACYTEADAKSRPIWLEPIYVQRALEVSPLLIDVEAAYEAGDLDQVMSYMNARKPALHMSIIESELSLGEFARHLRRFVFILDPNGRQLTLRFADCAVLAPLSSVLTPTQWGTITAPMKRWGIHARSGSIANLQLEKSDKHISIPLRLDRKQLEGLDEASEPDHVVAKVKMMHHDAELPGDAVEQHAWGQAARQAWKAAHNPDPLFLLFLTEAVLRSRGEILKRQEIKNLLAMDQVNAFRERLQNLVMKYGEKQSLGLE